MIDAILAAHADPDQPGATFRAIDAALAHDPGHILFTVLVHHPALKQSERSTPTSPTRIRSADASRSPTRPGCSA